MFLFDTFFCCFRKKCKKIKNKAHVLEDLLGLFLLGVSSIFFFTSKLFAFLCLQTVRKKLVFVNKTENWKVIKQRRFWCKFVYDYRMGMWSLLWQFFIFWVMELLPWTPAFWIFERYLRCKSRTVVKIANFLNANQTFLIIYRFEI